MHGASSARCLGLPVDKVGVQAYTFVGKLTDVPIPPAWDAMPIDRKMALAGPLFEKIFGKSAVRPSEAQIADVTRLIHQIGFRNVEGFDLISATSPQAYARELKANGVQAVASHTELDMAQWPARLAEARARGQTYVGASGFGSPGLGSLSDVLATARNLDTLGKAASAAGLRFYVHNELEELSKTFMYDNGDGKPRLTRAWEIVAAHTDPRYVSFEIDVLWALQAFKPENFEELIAFLHAHRDRIVMLHMKDLGRDGAMVEIGHGIIDWRRVIDAAGPQISYYLYEYDLPSNAEASARAGFRFLTCQQFDRPMK